MKFQTTKFKDLTVNYDKDRIPISSEERKNKKGRFPYYGAQGIIDYIDEYIFDGEYMLIAEDGENLKSRRENIAKIVSGQFWVNNHAHVVRNNDLSNLDYLCYLINMIDISGYITGSAQPKLNQNNLNNIQINIPSLECQYKISIIPKLVDEKIEIIKKINKNLENIAQKIFKENFFNNEINELYNNYLKSGFIPENHFILKLKENCKFIKGKKPKNILDDYENGLKLYLTIDVLKSNVQLFAEEKGAILANKKDLLMVMDGASSGNIYFGKKGIVGSTIAKIESNEKYREIIFNFIRFYEKEIKKNNTGSAIPHVDKGFVLEMELLIPKNIFKIDLIFKTIRERIIANNEEILNLITIRDILLPKLMSGEIDVSNLKI